MDIRNKTIWHWLGFAVGLLMMTGTIFYLYSPSLFTDGMMHGGDESAHMFLPKYALEYFRAHHHLPVINPYWYNGIETFHHAPTLDYFPITLIYIIVKNIYLTNRIFTWLLLWLAGMSMFFVLYKRHNLRSAIIGGILYPYTTGMFYLARTSVTRFTPLILFPLGYYFTDEILEKDFRFRNFLILTVIMAGMILSHPVTGVSAIFFLGFYSLVRLFVDQKIQSKKLLIWLGSFLIASGLSAWFALPFLLEPSNYTYPAEEVVSDLQRTDFNKFFMMIGGGVLFFLGIFSFWRQKTAKNWALLISLLFGFFWVTPLSYPVHRLIPWYYPFTALVWVTIVTLYWVTTLFEFPKLKSNVVRQSIAILGIPLIVTLSLLSFDKTQPLSRIYSENFRNVYPTLEQAFRAIDNPGRVFYTKPATKVDWVIPADYNRYSSEGHYFSITRLNKELAWLNDAYNNGYFTYLTKKMAIFNDRFFIHTMYAEKFLNNNPELRAPFDAALKEAGFKRVFNRPGDIIRALYYQDKPSNYLIPLEDKTLMIGKHSFNYAAIQPNSYIGGSIYIDDYDLEFLQNFDSLVLYGFGYHSKTKAENLVKNYAKGGGRVVIDLLNVQHSQLEAEDTFLGVQSNRAIETKALKLKFNPNNDDLLPSFLALPSTKDFGADAIHGAKLTQLKEWRFTEYYNLDGTLVSRENLQDGDLFSLIGYKNVDGQKIWFLGGNIIYHAYLTHNQQEQDFLRGLITKNTDQISTPPQPNISITSQNLDPEAGILEFSYYAPKTTPLLVSYTISPHWKAYVNGKAIKINNLDAMMALNLPAGNNHVKLRYENLSIHSYAKGITLSSVVLLGVIFYLKRRRKRNV